MTNPSAAIRVEMNDGLINELYGVGKKTIGQFGLEVEIINPGRIRCKMFNQGKPEYTASSFQVGDRYFFNAVGLGGPPGWVVEYASERRCVDEGIFYNGFQVWTAVTKNTRKPTVEHNGVIIPMTLQHHFLEGGEQIWWDFIDPNYTEQLNIPIDLFDRISKKMFGFDSQYDRLKFKRLEKLRKLFTMDTSSGDRFTTKDHNLGWLMKWAHVRYAGNQDGSTRIPDALGYHDFGGIIWSDGFNNCHYNVPLYCIENAILNADLNAWRLALLLCRHQAQHGFVQSVYNEPSVTNCYRYEKSTQVSNMSGGYRGKVGDFQPPRDSHMFGASMLLVATISGDPGLKKVADLFGARLLANQPNPYYWGIRSAAWNLENLYYYWIITQDVRYKNVATSEINRYISGLAATDVHWPDRGSGSEWYPWQDAIMNYQIARWINEGICSQHSVRIASMIEESIDKGTRIVKYGGVDYLQSAMTLNPDAWQAPSLTSFFLPTLAIANQHNSAKYKEKYEAAIRTVGELVFQTWNNAGTPLIPSEAQIDCSEYGFGAVKIESDILWGARPILMKGN